MMPSPPPHSGSPAPAGTTTGLAIAASSEPGEPAHGGPPAARTVWVRWTAPASDRYLLVIDGNVTLGRVHGPQPHDDQPGGERAPTRMPGASLRFAATAGTEYRIAVSWNENEPYPTSVAASTWPRTTAD